MQPLNFKSLKLYCSDFGLDLTNLLSRCWSSGQVCLLPWPHGRIWRLYINVFLMHRPGGMPILKKGEC
jgi:hypothetical protein